MVAGFLAGIAETGIPVTLTAVCGFQIETQRTRFPQIEWFPDDPATRARLVADCEVWVGLGGTMLQALDDTWMLADQLAQLETCGRLAKPAFFFGVGVDRRDDAARSKIQLMLDQARWIWTRDERSTAALRDLGCTRVTTAADLSHLALRRLAQPPIEADVTGFICNFEQPRHYTIPDLASLVAATGPAARPAWLVQEVRALPGSERDLHARLPDSVRNRLILRLPDYRAATVAALIGSWGCPARLFSTRYHGAVIGAWSGSRVAVFARHQKLLGIAEEFGLEVFSMLPDADELARAFETAAPVPRARLAEAADRAQISCLEFLQAAQDAADHRRAQRDPQAMSLPSHPRVELHALNGITETGIDRVAPGLKRGEIFVVRGCLQAAGALEPLRAMILDTIAAVAGPAARARTLAEGLTRLHEFIPVEQLTQMNPLMKQRARGMAGGIVARLAEAVLGLGPDVHFEDTPNVRIFIPHDVGAQHDEALRRYSRRRGSGGELTLHPPHQDSRHFHPTGAINIWCALDRVVEGNAMSVFPKFYGHHLPYNPTDGGVLSGQYLGPPITMDLDPGDALIFETLHLHGSTLNQTDQTRFVISFRVTTDVPRYPVRPWYNYVRPSACTADGPPPNRIDYSQQPSRGPVTLDTSGRLPAPVVAVQRPDGAIELPSGMIPDGEIRPVSDQLCVARIDGRPVAFHRLCPHEGADLAGGAVRDGQIVCAWHGLRLNPATGRSGCRSLAALTLFACSERDGVVTVTPQTSAAPEAPADEHAEAVEHFLAAVTRFHKAADAFQAKAEQSTFAELVRSRDAAAYALLGLPGDVIRDRLEAPVGRLLSAIAASGVRRLARTAEQEATFTECCRRLDRHWDEDAGFAYGLPALALARHGTELVPLRPLARDLGWAEPHWLQSLLETPPLFLRPGEADRFAETLAPLAEQLRDRLDRAAPEQRTALATLVRTSDVFIQGYFNDRNLLPAMTARARLIERMLQIEGAEIDQLMVRAPSGRPPRIGFVVLTIGDGPEGIFLLAHLEHLAANGFDVRLYSVADPASRLGMQCRSAAAKALRLPRDCPAAVRLLRAEDLDIAVFATNLAATIHDVVALASHRIARIQVNATFSPTSSGLRHIDVMLSSMLGEGPGAEAQYSERLVRLPGSHACFPFQAVLAGQTPTTTVSRAALGIPDAALVYVSAANCMKIIPELSRAWVEIVRQVPDSYLVLAPFGPSWRNRYDTSLFATRLNTELAEAGLGFDRVRVLNALPSLADLHQALSVGDIYLDSFPVSGACSIIDPLVVGLPIVACAGATSRCRQAAAMLRELGLDDWVTDSVDAYLDRAIRLGLDADFLADQALRLAEVTANGLVLTDTARYAAKLAPVLTGLLADWDQRSKALAALPETVRATRIAELAAGGPGLTPALLMQQVVAPYLRRNGSRHFIHIGSALEATADSLVAEGWTGLWLDADGRPQGFQGSADGCAASIEAAQFTDADFLRIDAAERTIEVLTTLNFSALAPRLIMIGQPAGHDQGLIDGVLAGMRMNGYRALVREAGGATQAIHLDRTAPGAPDRTILFFRTADFVFLPSLIGWLEDLTRQQPRDAAIDDIAAAQGRRPKTGPAPHQERSRIAASGGA